MPVNEVRDSLFTLPLPAIGHGCNCTGVMGAGIAAEFRRRWPEMYAEYKLFCDEGLAAPGDVYPYEDKNGLVIFNLLTQPVPGPYATLDFIESAVRKAIEMAEELDIHELGIPRIGAGLGGLKWSVVRERLEKVVKDYPGFDLTVAVLSYGDPSVHPDVSHLSKFPHRLYAVNSWLPSYDDEEKLVAHDLKVVSDPDKADLITSSISSPTLPKDKWHTVMLDLDVPATLVPSTTPGHFHLYIDRPVTWDVYREILEVLAKANIVEPGYVKASLSRGFTSLRLPWVRKKKKSPPL